MKAFEVTALVAVVALFAGVGGAMYENANPGSTPLAGLVAAGSPATSDYTLRSSCEASIKRQLKSPGSLKIDSVRFEDRWATPAQVIGLKPDAMFAFSTNAGILERSTPEHQAELIKGDPAFWRVDYQMKALKDMNVYWRTSAVEKPQNIPGWAIKEVVVQGSAVNGFNAPLSLYAVCSALINTKAGTATMLDTVIE